MQPGIVAKHEMNAGFIQVSEVSVDTENNEENINVEIFMKYDLKR